ncbi:hypothetical protein PIB30_039093 [Stylosanthes scabra]|uniref:Uncharacterized protein n=1 Tax=Stylosanthes scabra TaxID=79078 RepID=A0ABU6YEW9_9FABA|nr:hypothetical protein [Stylosanthes scabra]
MANELIWSVILANPTDPVLVSDHSRKALPRGRSFPPQRFISYMRISIIISRSINGLGVSEAPLAPESPLLSRSISGVEKARVDSGRDRVDSLKPLQRNFISGGLRIDSRSPRVDSHHYKKFRIDSRQCGSRL